MMCRAPEAKDELKWALDSGLVSPSEWRMNDTALRMQNLVRTRLKSHGVAERACDTCLRFVVGHH